MNKLQHIGKRGLSFAIALVLTAALSAGWMAGAQEGYTQGKLSIVTEPGEDSPYAHYFVGDQEKSLSDISWDDNGHTGKAVSLTGNGEYLELKYNQLQMHTMTFAGWFYWRGVGQGQAEDSLYKQRFFTLSHSDSVWLTFMPHAKDASRVDSDGKIIDGVYMGFAYNSNKIDLWNPAVPNRESYGIPLNEWHHIAVTMDGQSLKLYIDGRLWFEKMLILGVEEMRNNILTIGSGRWGDPTLNALIDDLVIYNFSLSSDQIQILSAGIDPFSDGASVPPTTSPSLPQEPTKSPATTKADAGNGTVFGFPTWSVIVIGGVLAVFVLLSIVLSFYHPNPPAKTPKDKTQGAAGKDGKGGGKP